MPESEAVRMGRNVQIGDLADVIMETLEDYADLAAEDVKQAVREAAADPLQSDLGGFDALYDADQGAGAKSRTDGVGEAVYALRTENIGAGG